MLMGMMSVVTDCACCLIFSSGVGKGRHLLQLLWLFISLMLSSRGVCGLKEYTSFSSSADVSDDWTQHIHSYLQLLELSVWWPSLSPEKEIELYLVIFQIWSIERLKNRRKGTEATPWTLLVRETKLWIKYFSVQKALASASKLFMLIWAQCYNGCFTLSLHAGCNGAKLPNQNINLLLICWRHCF